MEYSALYHAFFAEYQVNRISTYTTCIYTKEVSVRQDTSKLPHRYPLPQKMKGCPAFITGYQHCINEMFPVSRKFGQPSKPNNKSAIRDESLSMTILDEGALW